MKVLLHESWEDVQKLSCIWNDLLVKSASNTIFLSWEWIEAWWKNYGSDRPLFVLSVWEGNSLRGLAPFFVERVSRWGRNWSCLKLIGDGSQDSDYLDCIVQRGREHDIIATFVQFLESHRDRWDYLEFHGTPADSPCLAALQNVARGKSWRFSSEAIPCATLPLPRNWNDYLRSLKPRFRTKVRSTLSYFDERIGAGPYSYANEETIDQGLAILFDLHTRRWQEKNQPGVFRDVAKRNFYRDVSRTTLQQGWLAFHSLDWGERPLAMQFGFVYGRRFFLLQEGYDPEFGALRPGLALRGWLMRHWIEAGLAEYDFLAGAAAYKLEWGAQLKHCVRLTLAPSWRAAWVSFEEAHVRERSKEAVRSVIPESILVWRRKLMARLAAREAVPVPANSTNGHKSSIGQRAVAALYGATPLGAVGRAVASRYELDLARHRLRRRATPICHIFIYHRVNDDYDPFLPSIPVMVFRKQMEFLRKNFPVVSLEEIASGEFPQNREKYCIAITFDDGYRDNFLHAFPVLKDLGMPATFFLATGYIETGEMPWYDQVCWAFKLTTQPQFSLGSIGGPNASLGSRSERLQAMGKTLAWLREAKEAERTRMIPRLLEALGVPGPLSLPNLMLSWAQVQQMSKEKFTFGAHTVSHPALSRISGERLEAEILESKDKIEEKLQLPVAHFAYPFGQPFDINAESKQAVQRAGFSTAVTTAWGFNRPGDDLFELKRFNPWFRAWDFDPGRFGMVLDWYRLTGVNGRVKQGS
jgi:peptidoglycan/xylan/chitin deacetylase (PgdA/CDA1 family)/CelD/BcsL family acetyltransferase involved in cellulose biosynthesis